MQERRLSLNIYGAVIARNRQRADDGYLGGDLNGDDGYDDYTRE